MKEAGLKVSYDDGATWSKVTLNGKGGSWTGKPSVPRKADFVSLRVIASDHAATPSSMR